MKIRFTSAIRAFLNSRGGPAPISLRLFLLQRVFGINKNAYWPVHWTSSVSNPENISIGICTQPGLSPGCYIQGHGKIAFGQCVLIGPNVGVISANHSVVDTSLTIRSEVTIADYCWIGFGAVILPGVSLGQHTVVAANSVVVAGKYPPYCVLAGNPAKVVKNLNKTDCVKWKPTSSMHGYFTEDEYFSQINDRIVK